MTASLRTSSSAIDRTRGHTVTLTAVAGDLWVVAFVYGGGGFQYIKFDGSTLTPEIDTGRIVYAIVVPEAGSHTIETYTNNGAPVGTCVWALADANLGASVLGTDTGRDAFANSVTLDVPTEPYGIVLVASLDMGEGSLGAGGWTQGESTVQWSESNGSPDFALGFGYKACDAGATTPSGAGGYGGGYDSLEVTAIGIRGYHEYTQALSGGITPTNDPGNPGRLATGPGHQNFFGTIVPTGSLFVDMNLVLHIHGQGRPLGVSANDRDFHLHSQGRAVHGHVDQ